MNNTSNREYPEGTRPFEDSLGVFPPWVLQAPGGLLIEEKDQTWIPDSVEQAYKDLLGEKCDEPSSDDGKVSIEVSYGSDYEYYVFANENRAMAFKNMVLGPLMPKIFVEEGVTSLSAKLCS